MTEPASTDAVDRIVAQWHREVPELELEPMGVFGRIHRISALTNARLHGIFQRYGIGRNEFDLLASLRRAGDPFTLSPKQLSTTLMLTSGGLTSRLDKLERNGLIERLPDPADRRGLRIRLTDTGRHAIDQAVVAELDELHRLTAPLTGTEVTELDRLLKKLHTSFTGDTFD